MKHWYQHFLRVSLFLLITGLLVSCLNPQPQAPQLLKQAQALIDTRPDSAMRLIDSIFYPEASLRKPQYMQYLVTRVQARYKNYRPVAEDTLIFAARDYFVRKGKDPRQTTLACFYSGCVYREQDNFDKAMQQYKKAEQYAAKTDDVDLQGLVQYNMGDLLAEQGLHAQALEKYKEAEKFYSRSPTNPEEKQAGCLEAIGQMFLLSGENDNALSAFYRGIELAKLSENKAVQSQLHQNIGIAYREMGNYTEAERHLRHTLLLENDTTEAPRYYLNFAKLYLQTNQPDSLVFYRDRLIQNLDAVNDPYLKASAYSFLADDALSNKNYVSAFDYQKKRSLLVEEIMEKSLEQSVYEVQQKYDYELLQNRHTQTLLRKQRFSILLFILFLTASLAALVFQRKTVRQKNRLLSLQNAIETLDKTAKDLQKKQLSTQESKEQLRETLLWKFNVQHKAALLKSELQHWERMDTKKAFARFDDIVYGKDNPSQWNALVETIDAIYPGLSLFIRQHYPQFSDTEVNVCLLSYAGLNAKETTLILNQSPNTVNMARTRIRQKMNLTEPGADFCAALEKAYRGG